MSGVDDRIVSMKFDNVAFERRLSDTIKSLDNLKSSLDFASKTKGFEEITAAANNVNLSHIAEATGHIADKFNAMTVIATAALQRLVHKAVDAGTRLVSAFTFDPIKQGFEEFETNMNSIQTILANTDSKGTTLQQVNDALDQLNTYSDQTIYNFSEMARNIGTFTAAGVDLDRSVASIKGIANVAAISGSNSQQASTAMYQLSQAIATGSVKLMDWNSVVNAGMGGEVFQKALFDTAKKMKTISGVPMSMTFDQWKDSGNSFRLSLEQGWLTADVLTETLQGFTGDLTEAQLLSMGYTQEQAAEMMRLGALGKAAATEVKTLTQLLSTVKESVASGWSATFRTVIGDFEESKELFTNINNMIGVFVSRSADARNEMLKGWADFGGRTALIEAFMNIISAVTNVIKQITSALREFFPKTTTEDLLIWTASFKEFTERLKLGDGALENINQVFRAFFSILQIGWEVVKGVVGVIKDLFGALFEGGGDAFTDIARGAGSLADFNKAVLESGAIPKFFEKVGEAAGNAVRFVKDFIGAIVGFFTGSIGGSETMDAIGDATGRVSSRFEHLSGVTKTVVDAWGKMMERLEGARRVLDSLWEYISNWFKELGQKLAAVMKPGDFDAAVDIVNVGLLGGIAVLLKKFLEGGLKLDFGDGLIEKISGTFDQLTSTLKAMQADLKSKALLRIAGAVGILTASMVALSMIDSAGLTKALIAMGVGFGQLVAVMALIDKFGGTAIKTNAIAASMILMATAVGVLSIAVTNFSQLDLGELAKGLGATAVGLGLMVTAVNLISTNTSGMISAGVAMTAIAVAMRVLAEAVEAFAEMSWEEMAQGLVGVAVALGAVTVAMKFMPVGSTLAAGAAMIPLAVGLRLMAEAVSAFGDMDWGEMGKGLAGIGGSLLIIAGAMQLMPLSLPITAAGVLVLSGAMLVMAEAVENMSDLSWEEMIRGIVGFAGVLGVLVIAVNAMQGAAMGAAAIAVVSVSMLALAKVIKELSGLSWGELGIAMAALAGSLTILGLAAYALTATGAIGAMFAMGAALGLIGGAFALFGVGVMAVAKGFEILAESGAAGAKAIVEIIKVLATARIEIVDALVGAIIQFAQEILDAAPLIIKSLRVILGHILETIIELVPKIAEALAVIITELLTLIRDKFPELVETGYLILLILLQGVRDNIVEIVTLAVDIVTSLVNTLAENMPRIVTAAVNLITAFLTELAAHATELVAAGLTLLVSLIQGISNNVKKLTDAIADLIIKLLAEIAASLYRITAAGLSLLVALLKGISDNLIKVANAVTEIITKFIDTYSQNAQKIIDAGFQLLTDLLTGIANNILDVADTVTDIVTTFVTEMGANAQEFIDAGADALVDLLQGISDNIEKVTEKAVEVALKFIEEVGDSAIDFTEGAANLLINFLNDLRTVIDEKAPEIREAALKLLGAIFNAMLGGLPEKMRGLLDAIKDAIGGAVDKALGPVDDVIGGIGGAIGSVGGAIGGVFKSAGVGIKGAGVAVDKFGDSSMAMSDRLLIALERVVVRLDQLIAKMQEDLDNIKDPVIRPVVDMTEVDAARRAIDELDRRQRGPSGFRGNTENDGIPVLTAEQRAQADRAIQAMLDEMGYVSPIGSTSIAQARLISRTTDLGQPGFVRDIQPVTKEIKFEQNNYSPSALSTNDIYRNTKSQIALAKEELGIAS